MKPLIIAFLLFFPLLAVAQDAGYQSEMESFRKKYVDEHGAVKGKDRDHLHFFKADPGYRITARFERIYEAPWFGMITSDDEKRPYRVYGILHFTWHDTIMKLHIYESQDLMKSKKYADHLFIPFTDLSNGEETYENGRYIDVRKGDLEGDSYTFDFNKAYNPYCAYVSGRYSCPLPPKENALKVAIMAGEKKFTKPH